MTIGEHSLSPNNLLIKRALVEGDMIHNGTKILMGKIGVKSEALTQTFCFLFFCVNSLKFYVRSAGL